LKEENKKAILVPMKAYKSFLLSILILFYASFPLVGQSLEDALPHFSAGEIDELLDQGTLSRFFYSPEDAVLQYLPETFASYMVSESSVAVSPTMGVETLFLLPYPDSEKREESYDKATRILLSFRTMEGIEYYSASREKMRTLFTESVVIESAENEKELPDPSFTSTPSFLELTVRQTDLTFGTNIYQVQFRGDGEAMWLSIRNLTRMRYKFIPMVAPESLLMHLVVYPVDEGILFYGVSSIKALSFFGLERRKSDSFQNRIEAMKNWFRDSYGIE
jgi:hypothetical protein